MLERGGSKTRGARKIFHAANAMTTTASTSHTRPAVKNRFAGSLLDTEEGRDALAAADAGRGDAVSPAASTQLVQRREREPST